MPAEQASPALRRRFLCISLHDVAPATLPDCRNTLAFLDSLHIGPVALLVVPDYHGHGRVDRDDRFCDFLRARARRGDEIVLHGYLHRDRSEFANLNASVARARLLRGLAVLRSTGWHPSGFVPPAWLMSPGTCTALESLPLRYYATRDSVYLLSDERRIPAPSLVASTRGFWRRTISVPWNYAILGRHLNTPVIRAALHPRDLQYGSIESLWRRLLGQLAGRQVVTEGDLVAAL